MYRSPLAAGFFLKQLQQARQGGSWTVDSAGTWTISDLPLPEQTLELAKSFGFDLSNQLTRLVDRDLLEARGLILEFPSISGRLHLISEVADHLIYDIPDPVSSDASLAEIAAGLFQLIERGFRNIVELALSFQTSDT
jgi:protein-tyrosine-phosphatase